MRKGNLEGEYLLGLFNFTDERRKITAPLDKVAKDIFFQCKGFSNWQAFGRNKKHLCGKTLSSQLYADKFRRDQIETHAVISS